ncbi:hypothetical protein D7D52_20970 [Nocardia yunnanensis]|uniref:Uncharacterized protein n=2 Tax=Nocardia yunnanensis TaxID=2382165 RepID=A0A386ZE19_9NOCA|nr:hypothetical protein D7D52_20970 [Nocardia yunnanensis]
MGVLNLFTDPDAEPECDGQVMGDRDVCIGVGGGKNGTRAELLAKQHADRDDAAENVEVGGAGVVVGALLYHAGSYLDRRYGDGGITQDGTAR